MAKKVRGFDRKQGTLVRAWRREVRLSKAKLGQQAGCDERTIANVEIRRPVRDSTVTGVTDALNKALEERHAKGQLNLPLVPLAAGDLFEFDGDGLGIAKAAPQLPDDRRAALKAMLRDKAAAEKAS